MDNQTAYTLKEVQDIVYFSMNVVDRAIRYSKEKSPEKEKDLRNVYNSARKMLPPCIRAEVDHQLLTMGGIDNLTHNLLHELSIHNFLHES